MVGGEGLVDGNSDLRKLYKGVVLSPIAPLWSLIGIFYMIVTNRVGPGIIFLKPVECEGHINELE
jgi:hypothetical protein